MESKRTVKKPRSKSRKMEIFKKRQRRKRLLNRVFILVMCLSVLIGIVYGVIFLLGRMFDVREITVEGNTMYSDAEIIDASGFKRGDALLFLNKSGAEKKIYESFAYVDDVKVHRKLPHTLKIDISTAVRRFTISKDDVFYVISDKGKLLETVQELPSETVELRGMEFEIDENGKIVYTDSESKDLLEEIGEEISGVGLGGIRIIDLTNTSNIVINYEDRISIIIGTKQDLHYKIVTAKEIISNKINQFEKGELDLRNLSRENKSYFTPISA